jgi:hypothetical protein
MLSSRPVFVVTPCSFIRRRPVVNTRRAASRSALYAMSFASIAS